MTRNHMTKEDHLNLSRTYTQRNGDLKPKGLWYAQDNEWVEWVAYNMPHWRDEHNLELVVNNDRLLVIDSWEKLLAFQAQYAIGMESRTTMGFVMIDWERVSERYSGIEVRNYNEINAKVKEDFSSINQFLWFSGWDVNSGCIWDLSAIAGYVVHKTPSKKVLKLS